MKFRAHQLAQSKDWDDIKAEIFGKEDLKDDHLSEDEDEATVPDPLPLQQTSGKRSRNA